MWVRFAAMTGRSAKGGREGERTPPSAVARDTFDRVWRRPRAQIACATVTFTVDLLGFGRSDVDERIRRLAALMLRSSRPSRARIVLSET